MATDLAMSVLVVDDSRTVAQMIRILLAQIGFKNVDEAPDGVAALEKLRSAKYGLVISDRNMVPMSGLELLKEVRLDPELANLPFIIVTGDAKLANVVTAKKAGVDGYIVKPFSAQMLKAKIDAVLAFDPERRRPI
jgi:two-component system chemotaxis response regulator CheY